MSAHLNEIVVARGNFKLGPLAFKFESAGIYQILGKNGSGKTSLMRAIAGRLRIQSGKIVGFEKRTVSIGAESFLFSNWTVEENWNWFQSLANLSPSPLKSALQNFFPLKVNQLSAGQTRKIEFEIGAALKPEIFLLDEVFAPLDLENRKYINSRIQELSQSSLILMTSHQDLSDTLPIQGRVQL